jgi:hypothetical protein
LEDKTKCDRKEHKLLLTYINEYIKGTSSDKYWRLYVSFKLYKELEKVKFQIDKYCGNIPWIDDYKDNSDIKSCGLIILRYYDFSLLFLKEHNFDYLFPYFALLRGCLSDQIFAEIKPVYSECIICNGISRRGLGYRGGKDLLKAIDNEYYLSGERLNYIKHKKPPSTTYRINGTAIYIGILPKDIRVIIDSYIQNVTLITIRDRIAPVYKCDVHTFTYPVYKCDVHTFTYPDVLGSFEN